MAQAETIHRLPRQVQQYKANTPKGKRIKAPAKIGTETIKPFCTVL
jgi:hypothetical protein